MSLANSFSSVVFLVLAVPAFATQLPTKIYTTADGLPRNYILRVYHDAKGYLWFCTAEGLSRYDGYSFHNYGLTDGLPDLRVADIVEANDGTYWVGTRSGLCQLRPQSKGKKFFVVPPPTEAREGRAVLRLIRSRTGEIWAGTGNGLYRVDGTRLEPVELPLPQEQNLDTAISGIAEDNSGALWLITGGGLYRYIPGESVRRYAGANGVPRGLLLAVAVEPSGMPWIGGDFGLTRFVQLGNSRRAGGDWWKAELEQKVTEHVTALSISSDGQVWVGTGAGGLLELTPRSGTTKLDRHSIPGLGGFYIEHISEDRNGNRWLATGGGAVRISRNGFLGYSEADGLGSSRILGGFETRCCNWGVVSARDGKLILNFFDSATHRFKAINPRLPRAADRPGFSPRHIAIHTRAREWWIGTACGLARFRQIARPEELGRVKPRVYTSHDGLPGDNINAVFEDSRGDIWIGTDASKGYGLAKWDHKSNTLRVFGVRDGLPPVDYNAAWSFAEDRAGGVWIAFGTDFAARYWQGRFRIFSEKEGWLVRRFHVDRAGRLWFTAHHGVGRVDRPDAPNLELKKYVKSDGLFSDTTFGITDDPSGRIYIGTTRGLDRLDPETGRVRHYGSTDGVPAGDMPSFVSFHEGAVWYGTVKGLAKLIPEPQQRLQPPHILITGLQAGTERLHVSDLGEPEIRNIRLPIENAQLRIDFAGLSDMSGEELTYDVQLDDYDRGWRKNGRQRSVTYAGLGAGTYRFQVRAVNDEGAASPRSAIVEFTIVPAIVDRWWMRALMVLLLGTAAFAAFRYRTARLLELQRIRMRIATDLHDDVGASLSQIAILSEVARRNPGAPAQRWSSVLSEIAETSRQLVDAMSDIVWAIDPERDHVADIVQRMRQFAVGVCSARGIDFRLDSPSAGHGMNARSDVRRQVALVFKECINNALRHSQCTAIRAVLEVRAGLLLLKVMDNGTGFEIARVLRGRGLNSMATRASELGGELDVDSVPGYGTTVTLRAPLSPTRRRGILHKRVGTGPPPPS